MSAAPASEWARLSGLVAESLGLHFPPERSGDLKRAVAAAAREFGYEDVDACVGWLLSAPPSKSQLQVLASHLTIGETYFYRDPLLMEAFAGSILPELVRSRRAGERRLRLWSAACSSGEEAYSLAILLHRLLPDLRRWNVTITATDINPRFLHKAIAGKYGEWSFRGAPAWLKSDYFERGADGRYAISPEIAGMVTFSSLNLAEDTYPSLATGTNAMDIVFCRNVLMYFTAPKMREVISNLGHALVDGGWLAVSPSESSKELFPDLARVDFPGAIVFRKGRPARIPEAAMPLAFSTAVEPETPAVEAPGWWTAAAAPAPAARVEDIAAQGAPTDFLAIAQARYREGHYAEAVETLEPVAAALAPDGAVFSLLVHALANMGRLADALAWCDRWIAASKLDPAGHYLRAIVLLEQREPAQARASLQRATYLDPRFVLAHYALGNLARERGDAREASRHFANAVELLHACAPHDPLPESDGLTAGRLAEIIASLAEMDRGDES